MAITRRKILTSEQLKHLSSHKYNCINLSIIDPYLQPWWTYVVNKLPLWLAPNLITMTGLAVNIVTTLILVWFSPDAKTEAPRWAYFLCALGLFMYQTLDAIDGKQARRTNTSTPLGELFDHGCDSVSIVFVGLSACIASQLGHFPLLMFANCFCSIALFYCAHWRTYFSGQMTFGKVDVTEAQMCIMLIQLISALFGPGIWMKTIGNTNLRINQVTCAAFFLSYLVVLLQFLSSLVKSYDERMTLRQYFTNNLAPGLPLLYVIGPAYVVSQMTASTVYLDHTSLFVITFGLVAAKVTNCLVVCHMTKHRMGLTNTAFIGIGLLVLNQYFNSVFQDNLVLWVGLVFITFDLVLYSLRVCTEICDHLGIELFTIPSAGSRK